MLQIKGNQPTLQARIRALHQADPTPAGACHWAQERRRGVVSSWQTSTYALTDPTLQAAWAGLARAVVVVKTVTGSRPQRTTTRTYITSLRTCPVAKLAAGIRGHWGIENKLHRTRDVHFGQDGNGIRHAAGAALMALLNTLALNFLLTTAGPSVRMAQLYCAQNFKQLLPNYRT